MGDLRFAQIPVERKVLGGTGNEIPQQIRDLCKEMENIHKGRGTVPAAVAERLRGLGEDVDAIDLRDED